MTKDLKNLPWGQKGKLPDDAKRVFEGEIFDVYQWDQKLYDGTSKVFERLKRADTVQVIPILENDKVLLLEEEQPGSNKYLALPGGRVDKGEKAVDAAHRELLEETGMKSDNLNLYFSFSPFSKLDWTIHFYIARNLRKIADPKPDAGEKITTFEVSTEKFIKMVISEEIYLPELEIIFLKAKLDPQKMSDLMTLLG